MQPSVAIILTPSAAGDEGFLPRYETPGAAGADLRAAVADSLVLAPGERSLIPTGIALALPLGYEAQCAARARLRHGLYLPNGPGTVDSDYRGEVGVILQNGGSEPFTVTRGERVAQLVIAPVVQAHFEPAERLDETARGAGGFGSTGRQ